MLLLTCSYRGLKVAVALPRDRLDEDGLRSRWMGGSIWVASELRG